MNRCSQNFEIKSFKIIAGVNCVYNRIFALHGNRCQERLCSQYASKPVVVSTQRIFLSIKRLELFNYSLVKTDDIVLRINALTVQTYIASFVAFS